MTEEGRRNLVNQLAGFVEEYASAELVVAMSGRGPNVWIDCHFLGDLCFAINRSA
jgi:hypothetical protein